MITTGDDRPARRPARHPPRVRRRRVHALAAKAARNARVDQFDRGGSAIFAYGSTTIVRTTNRGRAWTAIKGPSRKQGKKTVALRLRDVDMTSANGGYALDTAGPRVAHDQRRQALDRAARDRHRQRPRARVRLGDLAAT